MAKQQSKSLDINAIVDKYKELKKKGSGGGDFLRLEDGETRVRVLQFVSEETGNVEIFAEFKQHVIARKNFYVCPKTYGKPCPICEAADKFWDAGEKDIAKDINAKDRFFFVVLHDGKQKILEVGSGVAKGITKYFADADYAHFTDLQTGHDVKIMKSGSGLDTEYDVIVVPKSTPVKLTAPVKDPALSIKAALGYKELQAVVASHFDLDAVGGDAPAEEEPEETEAEMKARFKKEAADRLKRKGK